MKYYLPILIYPAFIIVIRYQIKPKLGKDPILDDGNLFFNLTGERGDTGDRILQKSNDDADQCEFIMEAVSLLSLKVLTIKYDSKIGKKICENCKISL